MKQWSVCSGSRPQFRGFGLKSWLHSGLKSWLHSGLKGWRCLEACGVCVFLILSLKKMKKKAFLKFSLINIMLDHSEITGVSCQKVIAVGLIENIAVDLKNVRFAEGFLNVMVLTTNIQTMSVFWEWFYITVINIPTTLTLTLLTMQQGALWEQHT